MSKLSSYSAVFVHLLAGFFWQLKTKEQLCSNQHFSKQYFASENISCTSNRPYGLFALQMGNQQGPDWRQKFHQLMNPTMISFQKKHLQTFICS